MTFRKKFLSLLLVGVMMLLVGCGGSDSGQKAADEKATAEKYGEFKKLASQLYEVTYDEYQSDYDYVKVYEKGYNNAAVPKACSAITTAGYLGRNFDFIAGDAAEIIVRTTSKEGRYATIGMFGGMLWLNSDMMDAGLTDEDVKEFIPHFMLDGINEKGVAMESNVVNTLDTGGFTLHTNPGQKEVPQYCLIRYVLDRAASADEAVEIMKGIDIIDTLPDIYGLQKSNYELHFLITDKDKSYVVEFDNTKPDGEKMIVMPNEKISTNFYLHLADIPNNVYADYSEGIERYRKLKDNMGSVNSVDTMKKLMQSIRYTNTNRLDGEYAPGENFDNPYTGFSDHFSTGENSINYSNYREHIPEIIAEMKRDEAEITEILKDPKMNNPNHLWVTSHSVVYDPEKKTMSVAVYERFDKYFDYSL